MSILAKVNENVVPSLVSIRGHLGAQKEFMGSYQLLRELVNNEYIYKNIEKNYFFYYSGADNVWLFCYNKNDIGKGLGGIRVSLQESEDTDDNILKFDCYTYSNEWIHDPDIHLIILEDPPIIPE